MTTVCAYSGKKQQLSRYDEVGKCGCTSWWNPSLVHTRAKGITTKHPRVTELQIFDMKFWYDSWQACGYLIFKRRFVRLWSLLGRPLRKRVCPLSLCYLIILQNTRNVFEPGKQDLFFASFNLTFTFNRREVSLWIAPKIWTRQSVNPVNWSELIFLKYGFPVPVKSLQRINRDKWWIEPRMV